MYHDIVEAPFDVAVKKDIKKLNEKMIQFLENMVFRAEIFTREAFLTSLCLNHLKSPNLLYEDILNIDETRHMGARKLEAYQNHGVYPVEIPNEFEEKKK